MEILMSKKPSSQPKNLNLGLQKLAMQKKFPSFKLYSSNPKNIYWIGYLQPKPEAQKYKIMVQYNLTPRVYILSPDILMQAPHRYSDYSLCLYHPNDRSYSPDMLVSDTIIPWTSEWLYFYELWLKEGVWWGKEAPHSPIAKRR